VAWDFLLDFAGEGGAGNLQVGNKMAMVGQEDLPADLGERVVVSESESHADPIILILFRSVVAS
jgi:hypothetical protein